MKKILIGVLLAALLIIPVSQAALAGRGQTGAPAVSARNLSYDTGDAPAQTTTAEAAAPLLHAVLLAMLNQDAKTFDPADRELAWESLYNLLSLYGQMDNRSEYQGEDLLLPAETVRDYAASAIPDLSVLGELPEDLSDRMTHQPESGCYLVACGENSMSYLTLSSPVWENGVMRITGELIFSADGSVISSFQARLTPCDNMLGFMLESMSIM